MTDTTNIKQNRLVMAFARGTSLAVLALAVLGLASPFSDIAGKLSTAQAVAQEAPPKKKKTRRVPSLSEAVYKKLGKYKLALDDYNSTLRIMPNYSNTYICRANVYEKSGKYQLAIDDYSRAIEINPNDVNAYDKRGAAKWYLKLEYCSDFKKACDLDKCNNYNKFCK